MLKTSALGLCGVLGTLAACTDTGTLPRPAPSPVGHGDYSAGTPDPEPQWPVKIHSTSGFIQLPSNWEPYPATIALNGYMNYDAYHASIGAKLTVSGRNTSYQDFFPKERHTNTFFDNHFNAYWEGLLGGPCGNLLQLSLDYYAWWVGPGGWKLQERKKDGIVYAEQPACRTSSGGGGDGAGGGGGMITCFTETVHHYWYYPDTGAIEYRYTSQYQWCEPNTYAN